MQTAQGNRTRAATLAMAVLLGPFAARTLAAPASAFDFTGHWVGTAQQSGSPAVGVTADLTTTPAGSRKFTGTLTVAATSVTCQVAGKEKPTLKVKARLTCDDKSTVRLRGTLDEATRTVAGSYSRTTKHGKRHQGTFSLTLQAI